MYLCLLTCRQLSPDDLYVLVPADLSAIVAPANLTAVVGSANLSAVVAPADLFAVVACYDSVHEAQGDRDCLVEAPIPQQLPQQPTAVSRLNTRTTHATDMQKKKNIYQPKIFVSTTND